MLPGVYEARKKDGTVYYRSNITFREKHISLGSFSTERMAHRAYQEADKIIHNLHITLDNYLHAVHQLSFEKAVVLLNFRDNRVYIKNPIYLKQKFFLYFISEQTDFKFDIDDLFFYSSHKIIRRNGRFFVNEYGMQNGILSRYGIKSYAVAGIDFLFANGDSTDYRYENIVIINRYRGVSQMNHGGLITYKSFIHINGNYTVGIYSTEEKAAIAYNKAVDLAKAAGISRKFEQNYLIDLSAKDYADIYTDIHLSRKFLRYLKNY